MVKTRRGAALALAAVWLSVTASLAYNVLYADKFATLGPGWGAPSALINVSHGQLVITPEKNTTQTILNQAQVFPDDITVSCTMSFIKAPTPTWGSGPVFWAQDYESYYALLINAQGWFAVQRHAAGGYRLFVPWRQSRVIKQGEGARNRLLVVTRGDQVKIFINGWKVVSFVGQAPPGRSHIGFKASSGPQGKNSVAFVNLLVADP
jgi:hypothetical protein